MSVTDVSIPINRYFEEISAIPRGSGNEEGISSYLAAFAEKRGLKYVRDTLLRGLAECPDVCCG